MSKAAERTVERHTVVSPLTLGECEVRQREPNQALEEAIRRRIEENGVYAFYFSKVTCKCAAGVVKICGRVPTDRLKHVLWSLISDLDGVTAIDDQLDVISSTGLSSIRPK